MTQIIAKLQLMAAYYAMHYQNVSAKANVLVQELDHYTTELTGSNGYEAWKVQYDANVEAINATYQADLEVAKQQRDNAIEAIPKFSYASLLLKETKMNRARQSFLKKVQDEAWRRFQAGEPEMVYVEIVPPPPPPPPPTPAYSWVPISEARKALFPPNKAGLKPTLMREYGEFAITSGKVIPIPTVEGEDSSINWLKVTLSTGNTIDAEFGAVIEHPTLVDEDGNAVMLYDMMVEDAVGGQGILYSGNEGDGQLKGVFWHYKF